MSKPYLDETNARIAEAEAWGNHREAKFARWQRDLIIRRAKANEARRARKPPKTAATNRALTSAEFYACVLSILSSQFGAHAIRVWDQESAFPAMHQVEMERRYAADPNDARAVAVRLAETVASMREEVAA